MTFYPRNETPARTPAEVAHGLESENAHLRMRVAVLSEALRAAEEELNACRFGECAWAKAPPASGTMLAAILEYRREVGS